MIRISYAEINSDATSRYVVATDCKTVGDFINEWLTKSPTEWGYFTVGPVFMGTGKKPISCEYRDGEIIKDSFKQDILDTEIVGVSGSGGYSTSDFYIAVKDYK